MNNSTHVLLKEILPLLREVSEVMRATLETRLAARTDEAVFAIEELVQSGAHDRTAIIGVLEILGRGIALIPEIAELLKMFKS